MDQALKNSDHYLLITYSEWTSWVELAHLRINPKRIIQWKDEESPLINLERIIFNDIAPFINFSMLDAYLIVKIDSSVFSKDIYLTKSSHKIYPYSSCKKIIPFDDRSRHILHSESSRRQIEISYPLFEQIITPLIARKKAIRDLAIAIDGYELVSKYKVSPKERKYWTEIFNFHHLAETQQEFELNSLITKALSINPHSMQTSSRYHSCKRLWSLDLLISFLENLKLSDAESALTINKMKSLLTTNKPDSTNWECVHKVSLCYKKIMTNNHLPEFGLLYPYLLALVQKGDDDIFRHHHLCESLDLIYLLKKKPQFLFLIALQSKPHEFRALINEMTVENPKISHEDSSVPMPMPMPVPPQQMPPNTNTSLQISEYTSPGIPTSDSAIELTQPPTNSDNSPTADQTTNPQNVQVEQPPTNSDNSPTADQIEQQNKQSRENELVQTRAYEKPSELYRE